VYKAQNELSSTLREFKNYVDRAEDSMVNLATDRASYAKNVLKKYFFFFMFLSWQNGEYYFFSFLQSHIDIEVIVRKDNEITALKEER